MKTTRMLLVLVLSVLAGCAAYGTRGTVPMFSRLAQNQVISMEKDGLEINIFLVKTEEDAVKYFDKNILNYNILPTYFNFTNRTSDSAEIISVELKIRGSVFLPSTLELVYDAVKNEYWGKAFIWASMTYFVGGPISAINTYNVNQTIKKDIEEKNLESNKNIKPFGSSQGFVWFKLSDEIAPDLSKMLPGGMVICISIKRENKIDRYEVPVP